MKSLLAVGTIFVATVAAVAVAACGSGSSTSTDQSTDAGNTIESGTFSPDAAPTGTVAGGVMLKLVAPLAVTLPVGRQKDILITRAGDSAHAVALTLTGLPPGVTAMDATIGPMQMSTTMTLVADTNAVPNATAATITVKGLTADIMSFTTFPLTITGAPGSLDNAWGTKGITAGLMETGSQATGVGLQKNGSVVVGGFVNDQMVVARYSTAGVLDATFGTAGQTRIAPAGQTQVLSNTTKLFVDANDQSLMARQWKVVGPLSYPARFTAAGAPDTTFGAGGFGSPHGNGAVASIISDATGNVYIGGLGYIGRQSSTGVVDANFGISGVDLGPNRAAQGLTILSSGTIVGAGIDNNLPGGLVVTAKQADGFADTTFGGPTGRLSGTDGHNWLAVRHDASDNLFVAGQENTTKFLVGKITKGGAYDPTWNGTGIFSLAIGDGGQPSQANDVALQADGKVIAVGNAVNNGRSVMAVVRFLPSGMLDSSFGKDGTGIVFLPVAAATSAANAVVIQADGKILVAGHGDQDWAVARFWP